MVKSMGDGVAILRDSGNMLTEEEGERGPAISFSIARVSEAGGSLPGSDSMT